MILNLQWLTAFLLTELVETPIYCLGLRARSWLKRIFIALGASLLTHPLVWWSILRFGQERYWAVVGIAELSAIFIEAVYLRFFGVRQPLMWSLLANGASYGFGLCWQFFT